MIGRRVGAYELKREIGRGGMGAVYLAVRADSAFQKSVAIKLVKRGMDTDFILRRFRNERQILASLDHPNIGRLLDGGTTDDGRPFFVMEYIEGQPLYRYCDARKLGVPERLRLFSSIAEYLTTLARRTPLVLVLEDLHWADAASLVLLQHLARALRGERVLVLGSYRDVEPSCDSVYTMFGSVGSTWVWNPSPLPIPNQ